MQDPVSSTELSAPREVKELAELLPQAELDGDLNEIVSLQLRCRKVSFTCHT